MGIKRSKGRICIVNIKIYQWFSTEADYILSPATLGGYFWLSWQAGIGIGMTWVEDLNTAKHTMPRIAPYDKIGILNWESLQYL